MIKKFFMLAVAALALVACGDDEPDSPTPEPTVESKCEVTHTVNVAQDLLEVANVTIYII